MKNLSCISLLVFGILSFAQGLQVSVDAGDVECFHMQVEAFHLGLSFNYDIVDGFPDVIKVVLEDSKHNALYVHEGPEGRYTHPISNPGLHKLCFWNTIHPEGRSIVGFAFHVEDPTSDVLSNADATKIAHAQAVESLVHELNTNLETVKDTQNYMKVRVLAHHKMIDSTHDRVIMWSTIEAIVLIALSVWQITYIRRLIEVKRFI